MQRQPSPPPAPRLRPAADPMELEPFPFLEDDMVYPQQLVVHMLASSSPPPSSCPRAPRPSQAADPLSLQSLGLSGFNLPLAAGAEPVSLCRCKGGEPVAAPAAPQLRPAGQPFPTDDLPPFCLPPAADSDQTDLEGEAPCSAAGFDQTDEAGDQTDLDEEAATSLAVPLCACMAALADGDGDVEPRQEATEEEGLLSTACIMRLQELGLPCNRSPPLCALSAVSVSSTEASTPTQAMGAWW
mmetsp:Transcript_68813/g.199643  ORF Transcript_68813/g.199643 Transcript_68813/m.199643 type:complete len:242 (+) Transcript_68813:47-772(+)